MSFATRADLLARGSANRIAQLAVPTDMDMAPRDAVRAVLDGADVASFPADQQPALAGALAAVNDALSDADALILSYGIPADAVTPLLTRLACTIALYNLQGIERMTEAMQKQYDAVLAMLKSHAKGEISLIPTDPTDPADTEDLAIIESQPRRFGGAAPTVPEDW